MKKVALLAFVFFVNGLMAGESTGNKIFLFSKETITPTPLAETILSNPQNTELHGQQVTMRVEVLKTPDGVTVSEVDPRCVNINRAFNCIYEQYKKYRSLKNPTPNEIMKIYADLYTQLYGACFLGEPTDEGIPTISVLKMADIFDRLIAPEEIARYDQAVVNLGKEGSIKSLRSLCTTQLTRMLQDGSFTVAQDVVALLRQSESIHLLNALDDSVQILNVPAGSVQKQEERTFSQTSLCSIQ